MNNQPDKPKQSAKEFNQRLDFYWQFLSVYIIALLIYGIFKGSVAEGTFTIVWKDPVVILLSIFTISSAFGLLINLYYKKVIIIGKDFIIFKNRFKEKKYTRTELARITFSKERLSKFSTVLRVFKISINKRRKKIVIRPSSYWDDKEMIQYLLKLKKSLNI